MTNDVSVINAARCNATDTRGCRQPPPAIAVPGPGALTADPAAGTLYVPTGTHLVAMINTRTCNAHHRIGCIPAPPTVTVGAFPAGVAVNQQTHTVYVANSGSGKTGTVTVLDERTCNAATATGCTNAHTLQVPGGNPAAVAVNPATDTVYVATDPPSGPNGPGRPSTVSVFNGGTCNATTSTGCGQAPHTVTVGFSALALAVNAATDTIYVANFAQKNAPFAGNTVSVIDGATCNATTTAGCGHTPPAVTVGFGAAGIAFDPVGRTVAVTNVEDTSVSVINAATCNATVTISCHRAQPLFTVGRAPGTVAIDPAVRTIYTANGDSTVSIIPATR